ncbi:MAG: hypothetical protein ACRDWT_14355 [Jatrophihabitantaceae bacterium]
MNHSSHPLTARRLTLATAGGLAGALLLSACGGATAGTGVSTPPSSTSSSGASGAGPARTGNVGPAASGLVAQISGTTMQVQNQQSGQVAVTWSASTRFTQTVPAALAAVHVGDCLVAVAASGTASTATSFTAMTIAVSAPVNGSCTGGGARTGQRPSGFPSGQRPSGFPSGGRRPSGAPSGTAGRSGFGAFATGKVTAVSGSSVVLAAQSFGSQGTGTTTKTVIAGSTTKITTESGATAAALKVGRCVSAQGKAGSSGAVAATRVQITDATNGQCSTGFGFGGRNGG